MAATTTEPPPARPRTARDLGIMQGFPPPPEKRPTLENWDMPPFNRWSFQNVRSLFPTVDVTRGDGPCWRFTADIQDLGGIEFRAHDGNDKSVADFLSDTYTDGFLVLHRGRLLSEIYCNDLRHDTPHLSQSVAKSVVGTVAGILVGRSMLDPRAPLVDYVPELADCGYADARVDHAMNMTSGVRFTEDYGVPGSDMSRIDIASGWRPHPGPGPAPTIRDVILTLPKEREHGSAFAYRSIETDVLAWAMERATGAPLAEIVSRELWHRIGAETDAYFTVDAAGTALADGGFNATLRDYARFGAMMANGGRVGSEQIVPSRWIDNIRAGDNAKFGAPYTEIFPNGAYSHNWWINDVRRGDYLARGVFGQMIYIDPASELVVTKLSTWPDYVIPAFSIDTLAAIEAIRAALTA